MAPFSLRHTEFGFHLGREFLFTVAVVQEGLGLREAPRQARPGALGARRSSLAQSTLKAVIPILTAAAMREAGLLKPGRSNYE